MNEQVEEAIAEISRNQFLEMELDRLVKENHRLKRSLSRSQDREKKKDRIIAKQSKKLQQIERKEYYINVQKGIPKKKRR